METITGRYRVRKIKPPEFIFVALLFGFLFFSCSKKFETLEFVEVSVVRVDPLRLDSLDLIGSTSPLVESCGFIYANDPNVVLNQPEQAAHIPTSLPGPNGIFEKHLFVKTDKPLYFRAFAKSGARLVYSHELGTSGSRDHIAMAGSMPLDNDAALVYGQTFDLKGNSVKAHGHVYSSTDTLPAIGKNNCQWVNLGATNRDYIFPDSLFNLQFNTSYFVRAYLITPANDTLYSRTTAKIRTAGGWKQMSVSSSAPLQEGVGVALESKGVAYLGLGCSQNKLSWFQTDLDNKFLRFDPNAGTPANVIVPSTGFTGTLRTNASAFAIGDIIYVLYGEYNTGSPMDPIIVKDFRQFNTVSGVWSDEIIQPDPHLPPRRTGAAVFVLNDKAYLGTGLDNQHNTLSDFWEFNPQKGTWRKVASLPLRKSVDDLNQYQAGRWEAAAFSIDNFGYVGGGKNGIDGWKDFWRFTPPATDQDTGKWAFSGFFPGASRTEAVAFSVGSKGYYGTGYNTNDGYLDDFWEFNPANNVWTRKTPFRGGTRGQAIGLSLAGHGYIYSGIQKRIYNNGNDVEYIFKPDLWQYTPDQ
jgi:N-acetylneuraminic acid mutarotase